MRVDTRLFEARRVNRRSRSWRRLLNLSIDDRRVVARRKTIALSAATSMSGRRVPTRRSMQQKLAPMPLADRRH